MVKHAAKEGAQLFTAGERVERAFMRVSAFGPFSDQEQAWLGRIREVMLQNLSIDAEDFDSQPALAAAGGAGAARKAFGGEKLERLISGLNEGGAA